MKGFIITLVVTAIAIVIVTYILPSVKFKNPSDHIPQVVILALLIGLVNSFIKPIVGPALVPGERDDARAVRDRHQRAAAARVAYVANTWFDVPFTIAGFPDKALSVDAIVAAIVASVVLGHHHGGHRPRRPRLGGRPRRATTRCGRPPGGSARPSTSRRSRRPRRRGGGAARRLPRPVAARVLASRPTTSRRSSRGSARPGWARTSSRRGEWAAARPGRHPRTTGSRSRGSARPTRTCGRRSARRPTATRCAGSRSRAPRSSTRWRALARRAGLGAGGRAAARRPAAPQPGRHARDARRPGGRPRDLEVRDDRDRADGGGRAGSRVDGPLQRAGHPPPRRLAAGRGRRVARRGPARARAARPDRRGPRRGSTRSTSAAASRSASPGTVPTPEHFGREARALLDGAARRTGGPRGSPSNRAASSSRGAGWLVARVLHVRERADARAGRRPRRRA